MNDRVIDLSEQPAHLNVRNGLLVIAFRSAALEGCKAPGDTIEEGSRLKADATEPQTGLRSERSKHLNEHTVPLEDIAVLIASHPQITYSQSVLGGLAEA